MMNTAAIRKSINRHETKHRNTIPKKSSTAANTHLQFPRLFLMPSPPRNYSYASFYSEAENVLLLTELLKYDMINKIITNTGKESHIMKRRLLSLFLAAIVILSLSCCKSDTENITASEQSESIEYKTTEPPEGGWTTEEIMSVTYLCGRKMSYPLSLDSLGEGFRLTNYSRFLALGKLTPASLLYKGQQLANATVINYENEMMIYNIVTFTDICEVEGIEPFVINGVTFGDSYEDVLAALGEDTQYTSDFSISYSDRETGESLYHFFFENGKLDHININLRFEIDLPLYNS